MAVAAKRRSYFWARPGGRSLDRKSYPAVAGLSTEARQGLRYADALAESARRRRGMNLSGQPLEADLTLADLERSSPVSASTIRRRMAQARDELFGSLSDRGIYDRLKRERERGGRPLRRVCAARDCEIPLPETATARRKFHHPACRRREAYWRAKDAGA